MTVLPGFPFRLPGRRLHNRFKVEDRDRATGPSASILTSVADALTIGIKISCSPISSVGHGIRWTARSAIRRLTSPHSKHDGVSEALSVDRLACHMSAMGVMRQLVTFGDLRPIT
jgi:hypothetical protein